MDQRKAPSAKKELKDKSVPELLGDLARSIPELIRAEIAVVKAQVLGKASLAGQGAGLIIAAFIFLSMAIATGTALMVIVFDLFLPLWLAALLVTLLWLVIAGALGLFGVQRLKKLSSDAADKPDASAGKSKPPSSAKGGKADWKRSFGPGKEPARDSRAKKDKTSRPDKEPASGAGVKQEEPTRPGKEPAGEKWIKQEKSSAHDQGSARTSKTVKEGKP